MYPSTTVTCPNCKTPFVAQIEQVFDVGLDPSAKARFLRGHFNVITCPRCRYQSMIATPIVYHDPAKELLLTFVPMELGLPQAEQERMLGNLTKAIVNSLPPEQRKGYLLRPTPALTLQGMIDRVLESDGVTKEMMDAQRAKVSLIEQFLTTTSEEALAALAKEHDAELDYGFFDLFTAAIQAAAESGDRAGAEQMLALRNKVVELSSLGKQSAQQAHLFEATAEELNKLDDKLTPELFFDMVVKADSEDRASALVSLARPLVDYDFFMKLTKLINQSPDKERERLQKLRDLILNVVGQVDQAAQAQGQQAANLLRKLLEAPDLKQAVMENLPLIDNTFMAILNQNFDAARKAGRNDVAEKLQQIGDAILSLIRDSAPPEIKLINELLGFETEEESLEAVQRRSAEITPPVIEAMKQVEQELNGSDRKDVAERLGKIRAAAERQAMLAKWKA
ncbi:MAG: CpXC domain-containing protein [Chloroflexi bacterium]|nr:CpXC domain-containing protein [Chloroflexota bacterium]